ncbi:hypothetical protein [Caryophanon latum]|nr:hypothetical protein [Caryophanon latum]
MHLTQSSIQQIFDELLQQACVRLIDRLHDLDENYLEKYLNVYKNL